MQQTTVERIEKPAHALGRYLPEVFPAYMGVLNGTWAHGTLEPRLKELLRLKSADLAGCVHCVHMRYIEAQEQGLTEDTIATVLAAGSTGLSAREQAALDYTAAVASDPDKIGPALSSLRRQFSLPETIEITLHVLANNMFQSYGGVTHMAPTYQDRFFLEHVPGPSTLKGIPALIAPYAALNAAIWAHGTLSVQMKEMLRLKSAELSSYEPALRARSAAAQAAGLTEELIRKVADPGRSDLPERDRIALQFAELMITGSKDITDSFFDELLLYWSESQMVQLCWFALTYKLGHRFNRAMQELARHEGRQVVEPLREFYV